MKLYLSAGLFLLILTISGAAQSKTNDAIARQIKKLNSEKSITVSYDGNTSKVMAVAENFNDRDTSRVGIQAMNFAMGFFYAGDALKEAPDPIMLTFWILAKKPRFADVHSVTFIVGGESLVYDNVRYAAKAREDMEYINCKISRADLEKVINGQDVRVRLGESEFKLLPQQIRLMSQVLDISNTGAGM